jgi:hypothetical protein
MVTKSVKSADHSEIEICAKASDGISALDEIERRIKNFSAIPPLFLFFELPKLPLTPFFHRSPLFALHK